jgi:hypothetical protein
MEMVTTSDYIDEFQNNEFNSVPMKKPRFDTEKDFGSLEEYLAWLDTF